MFKRKRKTISLNLTDLATLDEVYMYMVFSIIEENKLNSLEDVLREMQYA